MNLLSFKTAKNFIRIWLFCLSFFVQVTVHAWNVDLSRRQKDLKSMELPATIVDSQPSNNQNNFGHFFEAVEPTQDIVIMNTDKGFVPSIIRLRKGQSYRIFVVNVNGKEKNASFILDSFSEHHATYFGEQKSFMISPKMDGIFSFQCPEAATQGKIIVFSEEAKNRSPASQ